MKSALGQAVLLVVLSATLAGITHRIYPARTPLVPGDAFALTVEAADQLAAPIRWVDARGRAAFEKQHIPGAVLLNEDAWEELLPKFLAEYSPELQVIVYCDSSECDASRQVAKRLREEVGLTNVFTLEGGWQAWQARAAGRR